VRQFVNWLSQTPLSLTVQTHEWMIPTIQSIHIVAIGVVMGSMFMMTLRIWGWAGRDQTLLQTAARFAPWLKGALVVLLLTGGVMVIGEPARELLALSFWLKMALVAIGTTLVLTFEHSIAVQASRRQPAVDRIPAIRAGALVLFLIWVAVIVLGRLIAYDYVWGSWSRSLTG